MTAALPVSLIVVSRHRPDLLRRCLTAVAQMDHPNFEVIVVADPAGLAVAAAFPVKAVACDVANISLARNLGIGAAAGEIVAFIDDDAVPEPLWLRRLSAPFAAPEVAAAGGFVIGTNGISRQWTSGTVDRLLRTGPLEVPLDGPSLHPAAPGLAVEIKGVNCAYRRPVIAGLGGFDGELRYHLDETELNLRLAAAGAVTAIVPDARVHHAKAASALRRADRTPRTLWNVGASTAVTLRRHGATEAELAEGWRDLWTGERAKLLQLMTDGRIEPGDVEMLLAGLRDGFDDGRARTLAPLAPLGSADARFRRFPSAPRIVSVLAGRVRDAARLRAEAARRVKAGEIVRLFLFSPTALYHRVRFADEGYWIQTGGLFGKSLRTDPVVRLWRFSNRLARELAESASGFGNT